MADASNLERAIGLVKLAIAEDENHNYADAYKFYRNALDYFIPAAKYEKNNESKGLINSKINEYLGRAEILKKHLMRKSSGGATPEYLERAIELVKIAIVEDEKHEYTDAYTSYQNALDYFTLALKHENNKQSKDLIKLKINEYLRRAETLKEHLMTGGNGSAGTSENLKRAIELVKIAVAEDEKHNYTDAYNKYRNALDHFTLAIKYEENDKSKDFIKSGIGQYLRRAEMLKEFLMIGRRGGDIVGKDEDVGEQNPEEDGQAPHLPVTQADIAKHDEWRKQPGTDRV